MYLELTPIEIRVLGLVTLEVNLLFVSFKKVLFKKQLWGYKAPTIRAKIVDTIKDEKDNSPPEIDSFIDQATGRVSSLTKKIGKLF